MISLRRARPRDSEPQAVTGPDHEEYPYGLRINLQEEEIEKLGIDIADLSMGGKVRIEAVAEVKSLSANDYGEGLQRSIDLQITQAKLEPQTAGATLRNVLSVSRLG